MWKSADRLDQRNRSTLPFLFKVDFWYRWARGRTRGFLFSRLSTGRGMGEVPGGISATGKMGAEPTRVGEWVSFGKIPEAGAPGKDTVDLSGMVLSVLTRGLP